MRDPRIHDHEQVTATTQLAATDLADQVWTFWSQGWLCEHRRTITVSAVLLIGTLAAVIGAIHVRMWGHDIFFLLDNGWRALHGQRVHVDYTSAWGPLTFLLVAGGLAISGGGVAAVSYANAFVASVLGLWSAALAAGRSCSLTTILYPCFVALLVAAPFALGYTPVWTSHAMVYNRYGYALLAIVILECFQPAADNARSRGRRLTESVLTGCATGLLLFLKITYFLVSLPILLTSLFIWGHRIQRGLGYASGFVITTLLFLAYLRFEVAAMVTDLLAAGAARLGSPGLWYAAGVRLVWAAGHAVLLGILAHGCARLSRNPEEGSPSFLQSHRYVIAAVVVVAADTLLLFTNMQGLSFPLSAAYAIVLLFSFEPTLYHPTPTDSKKALPSLILIAGLLAGPTLLFQSVGLVYGLAESRVNSNPPNVLRFDSPRLRPLVMYDVPPDAITRFSNGREYVASVNDGMRLLDSCTLSGDKIATVDMTNPFSYALERDPIQGGIAAATYQYTLDDRNHPSPDRFFGDAAVVMVPKYPALTPTFYDGFCRIYQPTLEREFSLQAESTRWWMYRRITRRDGTVAPAASGSGMNGCLH